MFKRVLSTFVVAFLAISTGFGQDNGHTTGELLGQDLNDKVNTITTAVPFLLIAPDARGGGMGDAGVASTPDANSIHYNPSKYAFITNQSGLSISYTPWLSNLIDDIHLLYLSGYIRYDEKSTLGGSLRYFSLGDIIFTDVVGNTTGQYKPNEFSLDLAYSRLLSRNFSGSIALRFIHSDLTGGTYVDGIESHPGNAVASDVSFYYQNEVSLLDKEGIFAWGINLSNLGSKISYTENAEKDFLPANLKLGTAYTMEIDDYNKFMLSFDINKLLVPTPPTYLNDEDGLPVYDDEGNQVVEFGRDPNVSTASGVFQSFYDAPGGGTEEFREFNYSIAAEYWYADQFALRAGYFYENPFKGNRNFYTVGMGLRLNVFSLDFSYLISPTTRHPLANTLRFTLTFDFDAFENSETSKTKSS
jgi:hypothetical protein